eukprot:symbB.v1.2.015162.t1/scaffold1126.1/size136452/3
MDSSDLACLGCSQCIVMADWGDQGISEVFRDLSTPSCAKVKLMSPSGSDGVVADVLISTESFGSSPYQRCFSYRLVGGQNCGVSEQVCAALPLAAASSSPKDQSEVAARGGPSILLLAPSAKCCFSSSSNACTCAFERKIAEMFFWTQSPPIGCPNSRVPNQTRHQSFKSGGTFLLQTPDQTD